MNYNYPNMLDNPNMFDDIVTLVSEDLNPLDLEIIATRFKEHGYDVSVREGRLDTPGSNIGEVKFAGDTDTGNTVGIDTTHGHRWTITPDPRGYKLLDHKLGVTGFYQSLAEAKGAALRAASYEADDTKVQPYGEEPTARPTYEDNPTLSVDRLRKLFPGHYLTK